MNRDKHDQADAAAEAPAGATAQPQNEPAGHPRRKGNEITGTHAPQPPSGLRPDLDDERDDRKNERGGDAGGVGKSL